MTSAGRRIVLSAAAIFGLVAPAIAAQDSGRLPGLDNFQLESPRPAPIPTPTPTTRAIPIPDAPRIVFPAPTASPTPRTARPAAGVTDRVPTDRPTATARNLPEPRATPAAEPDAAATPAPAPTATVTPQAIAPTPVGRPAATAPAPAAASAEADRSVWPFLVAALVVIGLAVLLLRRRRRPDIVDEVVEPDAAAPSIAARKPAPAPAAPMPVSAEPRAQLTLTLRPLRAGLNLLTAIVDCDVTITNAGTVAAQDIRLDVRLLSAGGGQDAELAAIYAQAPARPAVPVFLLEPGETRSFKAMATLARAAIVPMTAGNRPMFVPIVALIARYRANAVTAGQTSQAFAVGIERVDSAKLAPLWLDQPARMHTAVAARPHAAVLES